MLPSCCPKCWRFTRLPFELITRNGTPRRCVVKSDVAAIKCFQYANGLPSFHGAQVAVDVTLVCPIQPDGCPRPGADTEPGLALTQAEERKSRTYPEFGQQARCKLVVLALEAGGRWSTATQTFLRALARGRALASPSHSRTALAHALQRCWGQMLTVAANTAFSSSLLELPATAVPSAGALTPPLADIVADARWT